jgi:uncharacterized protein (TIGR03000 family)
VTSRQADPGHTARVIVELPAGARLYVDDRAVTTRSPGASPRRDDSSYTQAFNTPKLDGPRAYFYDLRAEVVRDGKTVSQTRRVVVRPGEVSRADFRSLGAGSTATAAAR